MVSQQKETARGQYKRKECPYCQAPVGNLPNHIRLKHPTEAPAPAPAPALTKEKLLGQDPPPADPPPADPPAKAKPKAPAAPGTVYACKDCHAEVRKGEVECWNCHAPLIWDNID